MDLQLQGIHHLTAITAQAQANFDFYTQTLGMRLVKKTVNQDDVRAYHLFLCRRSGQPGHRSDLFRLVDDSSRAARQPQHLADGLARRQC